MSRIRQTVFTVLFSFIILCSLSSSNCYALVKITNVLCSAKQNDTSVEMLVEIPENKNIQASIKYTQHEGKSKKHYVCLAKNTKYLNQQDAVVPKLLFEFHLDKCEPELPLEFKAELLENPNLVIKLQTVKLQQHKEGYTGSLQWLNKFQPNDCTIPKFDISKLPKESKFK